MKQRNILWFLVTILASAICIWTACSPIFEKPQLEPDDHRYLLSAHKLDQDFFHNIIPESVVENRWDHLWWIEASGLVRFFRPALVLSYWIELKLFGEDVRSKFLVNAFIHFVCSALVCLLIMQLVGCGPPMLLGTLLFSCFYCHSEVLWYVAGRTDSLAALWFLLGLNIHLKFGHTDSPLKYCILLPFFFGLFTKELTAGLPLLCLIYDCSSSLPNRSWKVVLRRNFILFLCLLLELCIFLAIRYQALGGVGNSFKFVFPYFVSPLSETFTLHIKTQLRSYLENIFVAHYTPPFLQYPNLRNHTTLSGALVGTIGLLTLIVATIRNRHFFLLVAMIVLTWLPTSFAYITERYLYLPSAGIACLLAVSLAKSSDRNPIRIFGLGLAIFWIGHQGLALFKENKRFAYPTFPYLRESALLVHSLREVSPMLIGSNKLLFINFPGSFFQAQFLEDTMQYLVDSPQLSARIVTRMPLTKTMGSDLKIAGLDASSIRIESLTAVMTNTPELVPFPLVDLSTAKILQSSNLNFSVKLVDMDSSGLKIIDIQLQESHDKYIFLQFIPSAEESETWMTRVRNGKFTIIRPN